ncbi:hypothetical protein NDQ52_13120 [Lactiplantibacillus plantarum]|uniref:hypothetical protein n=1 Tax=Lactiplantibacillus plantarum TaxID=1590 RepID=UPI002044C2D0|nr:hypothetical protein [Lactiplantibacillus plantarum]MCM2629177.1 hypothetical protein [Lactiplantibacillus plantarum]
MQLKPLLRQLATTFEVTVDPTFTHNPYTTMFKFKQPSISSLSKQSRRILIPHWPKQYAY